MLFLKQSDLCLILCNKLSSNFIVCQLLRDSLEMPPLWWAKIRVQYPCVFWYRHKQFCNYPVLAFEWENTLVSLAKIWWDPEQSVPDGTLDQTEKKPTLQCYL